MYRIYKNNRSVFTNKTFASYEAARLFLRKYIRKNKVDWKTSEFHSLTMGDVYRTPSISIFGYSIKNKS